MAYLNPNTIVLNSFSSPTFVSSDFLVENVGFINNLQISIDRSSNSVSKSITSNGITFDNGQASILLSNDNNIPSFVNLNENYDNELLHTNFQSTNSPETLIKGAIFCIAIKNIFSLSSNNIGNIDFTQDNIRLNQIFFQNDPTNNIINDIKIKSEQEFSKTVVSNTTSTDEYAYWDTIIGSSNSYVPFQTNDKMYVFYGLFLNIASGNVPDVGNNDALSSSGNASTSESYYSSNNPLYFVMSWKIII
tara:strand:- start:17672 stop:18415 length:744 start_codon:yes stop_codon:yes gene_type:complete